MRQKVKEFVNDVVNEYPGSNCVYTFPSAGDIEVEFDDRDSKLPIMLTCNSYWFGVKDARKIAKILNAVADAVEAKQNGI